MSDRTCNVYDERGRVVVWRSWNCPIHRTDPPPSHAEEYLLDRVTL